MSKWNKFDWWFAVQIGGIVLIAAFWCAIIYVAWHFVVKHW